MNDQLLFVVGQIGNERADLAKRLSGELGRPVLTQAPARLRGVYARRVDLAQGRVAVILQERQAFDFQALTKPDDQNVFMQKKYIYGVDGRMNAGYGFPQLVWGSKQPLTEARYVAARAALAGLKGDNGKRLGVKPTLLVTGPANEGAGLQITTAENNAAGATNVYKGTARLKVTPWLAA